MYLSSVVGLAVGPRPASVDTYPSQHEYIEWSILLNDQEIQCQSLYQTGTLIHLNWHLSQK